jgi:hypothetical protein
MDIVINVDDWQDELNTVEPDLTKNPIIDLQLAGMKPAAIARLLIVARERGDVADEVLPANKMLLMTGGAVAISRETAFAKTPVKVGEETYQARAYVSPVGEEEEGEEGDQSSDDTLDKSVSTSPDFLTTVQGDKALEYASKYLEVKVPGYIWGRLLVIAANGGDVKVAGKQLKVAIDEMVKELDK